MPAQQTPADLLTSYLATVAPGARAYVTGLVRATIARNDVSRETAAGRLIRRSQLVIARNTGDKNARPGSDLRNKWEANTIGLADWG